MPPADKLAAIRRQADIVAPLRADMRAKRAAYEEASTKHSKEKAKLQELVIAAKLAGIATEARIAEASGFSRGVIFFLVEEYRKKQKEDTDD